MTTTTGERFAIWGSLGVALIAFAGAGGLYVARIHHAPPAAPPQIVVNVPQQAPPNVIVQAPIPDSSSGKVKPYVCTPAQAEAGECLPLIKPEDQEPPPPEWKCTPKADWNDPRCPNRDLLSATKGRRITGIDVDMRKHKKKAKTSAKKKLHRDWKRAEQNFPLLFQLSK